MPLTLLDRGKALEDIYFRRIDAQRMEQMRSQKTDLSKASGPNVQAAVEQTKTAANEDASSK